MYNHEKQPMLRVNKERPCPVCGKSDWCLRRADGSAAICARIEQGSTKRAGDAGWLFVFDDKRRTRNVECRMKNVERASSYQSSVTRYQPKKNPSGLAATSPSQGRSQLENFAVLAEQYRQRVSERQVRFLGQSLGVTADSLKRLGIGWDGEAFCFPMCDSRGTVIGIRRRLGNGRKICVTGSRNGLFIPAGIENATTLVITEGPTDCCAALDLGQAAIGRPNCDSKIAMTVAFVRRRPVVIVADRDSAGMHGARKLYEALIECGSAVRIVLPPAGIKDLRQWKQSGGRIVL
jgi:phage/plasmid primase-like uncharacterized protein